MRAVRRGVHPQLFTTLAVDNFLLWSFPALGGVRIIRQEENPPWFGQWS